MDQGQRAARKASLLKLRENGLTQQQIGDLMGISRQRVQQLLVAEEAEAQAVQGIQNESDPETQPRQNRARRERGESRMNQNRQRVAALRQTGMTYPEIAKELGLSVGYTQVLNGSDGRRGGQRTKPLSDTEILDREIRWYLSKDLPIRVIATILDEPIRSIRYRIRKLGLDLSSPERSALWAEGKQRCNKCHEIKPLSEYSRNKASANGYQRVCRQCVRHNFISWSSRRNFEDDGSES